MNSCVIYAINELPEDSAFVQGSFIYSIQSKILIETNKNTVRSLFVTKPAVAISQRG